MARPTLARVLLSNDPRWGEGIQGTTSDGFVKLEHSNTIGGPGWTPARRRDVQGSPAS